MTDQPPPSERPAILTRDDGATIAYRHSAGQLPGVMFLTGFRSDMNGAKAVALEQYCRQSGRAFVRFDYFGHGESSGRFVDGTIGRWIADARAVLDRVALGPQVVVGSSMGGWIMLHLALQRPGQVAALVGLAAAPDFTEDLMWQQFPQQVRDQIARDGVWLEPSDYDPEPTPITLQLIEEGRRHLLLDRPIAIHCPVRLIHGMRDPDVPWMTSPQLADRLLSTDVSVKLVKRGDHRLSREEDIAIIWETVEDLCRRIESDGFL